jgi:hypothetical protein
MLVKRLLQSALVKYYSSSAFFERVIIQPKRIIIILPKAGDNEFYQKWFLKLADLISKEYKDSVHFVQKGDSLKLHIPHTFNVPEAIFEFLAGFSRTVSELYQ